MTETLESCRQKAINTQTHSDIFATQTERGCRRRFDQNNNFHLTSLSLFLSHVHTLCFSAVPRGLVSWRWSVFPLLTGSQSTSSVSSINELEGRGGEKRKGLRLHSRTFVITAYCSCTRAQTAQVLPAFSPPSAFFLKICIAPPFCKI